MSTSAALLAQVPEEVPSREPSDNHGESQGAPQAETSSDEVPDETPDSGVENSSEESEDRPPRVLFSPVEEPLLAAPEGAEVLFLVVVAENGRITDAELLSVSPASLQERSLQNESLQNQVEEAARAHLQQVRLEAAVIDGAPAVVRVQYRVVFPPVTLHEDGAGTPSSGQQAQLEAEFRGNGTSSTSEPGTSEPGTSEPGTSDSTLENPPQDDEVHDELTNDEEDYAFGATAFVEDPLHRGRAAISELNLELGQLRRVPRDNAQNLLSLAPGLLLTQLQNEGHASAMFLRGFDAEEGEDLEVLLQGIPLNEASNAHGHGYSDTLVILPQLVDSVRVVQGPFDPAQGDFATAGTVDYQLGLRERGLQFHGAYGSYAQRRLGIVWGPEGQETGTFAGFMYNGGNGWGTNRAFSNVAAMGQYEGFAQERQLRYRLLAFAGAGNWAQAGLLREDDLQRRSLPCDSDDFEQFYCTYDPRQRGSSMRIGGSGEIQWQRGPSQVRLLAFASARRLRIQENFTGFTGDPRNDGGEQRGDLADQQYGATTIGLRASYRQAFEFLERNQRLEVGVYARQDFADTALDRIRSPRVGPAVPYATDFDRDLSITNIAGYLRFDFEFADWIQTMLGARLDAFGFQVTDRNFADEDIYGERLSRDSSDAFGLIIQPRGALRILFMDELKWITSIGRGSRSTDAAALSEGELAPFAEVLAAETGLALELGDQEGDDSHGYQLSAGISAFYTRVSQDLLFDAANGRNTVVGPSARSGVSANVRFRLPGWLDTQLAITRTQAHLQTPGAGKLEIFDGPRLPYIPDWLVRLDSALTHTFRIRGDALQMSLALGFLYLSPRPLPFGERSEPWFVADAALSARWRAVEIGVTAQNLFNQRYRTAEFNYVSNFGDPGAPPSMMASRHFAAAPPLRVLATLTLHLQFATEENESEGAGLPDEGDAP